MARLRTALHVARTGTRVIRRLTRVPGAARVAGVDPWRTPSGNPWPAPVRRARRVVGAGVVLLLALAVAALLGPLALILGVGTAQGSAVAGWLLGLTLLLGVIGALWAGRRVRTLLSAPDPAAQVPGASALPEETTLIRTLRTHERALPPATRPLLRATVLATREALRVSAGDVTLDRDTYDVRQAAREELPELLSAYRAAPASARDERELARQLTQIEGRMQAVIRDRQAGQRRALEAQHRFLDDKYGPDEEPTGERR